MEQIRATKCAKSRIHNLYFFSRRKIWTLLRTRVAQFPSILPVFAKGAIFRNIVAFSLYIHRKNKREIHRSSIFARDNLGIPLRRNEDTCNESCVYLSFLVLFLQCSPEFLHGKLRAPNCSL